MNPYFLFLVFGAIIIFQSVSHAKERKDLYTRLMARNLTDYRAPPAPERGRNFIHRGE